MILCQNFSHNLSICWYMLMFSKSGNKKRKVKIGSDQHRRNSRWNRSASSSHSVNPFNCWGPFWLYRLINFEGWPWLTSQLINQGTYIYMYMNESGHEIAAIQSPSAERSQAPLRHVFGGQCGVLRNSIDGFLAWHSMAQRGTLPRKEESWSSFPTPLDMTTMRPGYY